MTIYQSLLNYALAEEAFDQWKQDRLDSKALEATLLRLGIKPASLDVPTISRAIYLYRCEVLRLARS